MKQIFVLFSLMFVINQSMGKNVVIDIITDDENCPVAVAPDVACRPGSEDICLSRGVAHKITWKYRGRGNTKPDFQIVMKNASHHGIFLNGCHQSSRQIKCRINDSSAAGSYAYSVVNAEGCERDPRIIINN